MKETYLIYFKSGSSDEYVMKTKDPSCKEWMANDFVKKYIPSEYEGCDDDEFIYLKFGRTRQTLWSAPKKYHFRVQDSVFS